MLKETKKEFIQLLKDYRQLVNKKHSDIEAYKQIIDALTEARNKISTIPINTKYLP